MRGRLRWLAVVLGTVWVLGGALAAGGAPVRPLRIHGASLVQDGQQLVFAVRFDSPVDPVRLLGEHRGVCLLREREHSGRLAGRLCLAGSGATYTPSRGRARPVRVTVLRSGPRELVVRFRPAAIDAPYVSLRWQASSSLTTGGCATESTPACRQLFPGRPAFVPLHVPRLVGCAPSGPPYVTNGPRSRHVVAFTFDDGPWPDTPQFLALLQREHVPATFFQIGEQVPVYGSIDRQILADGDLIGDHTWNHADVAGGGAYAAGEIAQARDAIVRRTGFTPCLFRAPGGAVSSGLISLARSMGFITIEWDVDTRDWSLPGEGAILGAVLGETRNGSIILQHDGGGNRSETLAALPQEISALRRRGYGFVTIPELLGLRLIYK